MNRPARMPQIFGANGAPVRDLEHEQFRAILQQQGNSIAEMADRLSALTDAMAEATPGLRENYTALFAEKSERRAVMTRLYLDDPPLEDFAAKLTAWNEAHPQARIGAQHFPPEWVTGKLTGAGTMGRARRKAFALGIGVRSELAEEWYG